MHVLVFASVQRCVCMCVCTGVCFRVFECAVRRSNSAAVCSAAECRAAAAQPTSTSCAYPPLHVVPEGCCTAVLWNACVSVDCSQSREEVAAVSHGAGPTRRCFFFSLVSTARCTVAVDADAAVGAVLSHLQVTYTSRSDVVAVVCVCVCVCVVMDFGLDDLVRAVASRAAEAQPGMGLSEANLRRCWKSLVDWIKAEVRVCVFACGVASDDCLSARPALTAASCCGGRGFHRPPPAPPSGC